MSLFPFYVLVNVNQASSTRACYPYGKENKLCTRLEGNWLFTINILSVMLASTKMLTSVTCIELLYL